MPNLVSSPWQTLNTSFSFSSVGEFSKAFSLLGTLGQDVFNFLGFGLGIHEVLILINRKDLKFRQKILPFLGYGSAALMALATGITICITGALLLPIFIFAGSIANIFKNIGMYFEERSEKRNLEKAIYASDWNEKINHLPTELQKEFKDFMELSHFKAHKVQELYVKIGNHFINKTVVEQQNILNLTEELKKTSHPKEKKQILKEIKIKKKALKDQFKNENSSLFELLEKKQRLNFLEDSGKRRLVNISLSVAIAGLSLLAWVVPLMIAATPAAPLAPVVYGTLGGVSTGIAAIAGARAFKTTIEEYNSAKKVQEPQEKISKAVFPTISKSTKKALKTKKQEVLSKPIEESLPQITLSKHRNLTHSYSKDLAEKKSKEQEKVTKVTSVNPPKKK